jgi:hypothetical protein
MSRQSGAGGASRRARRSARILACGAGTVLVRIFLKDAGRDACGAHAGMRALRALLTQLCGWQKLWSPTCFGGLLECIGKFNQSGFAPGAAKE